MAHNPLPSGTTYRHLDAAFEGPECWCDELVEVRWAELVQRDLVTEDIAEATIRAEQQDREASVVCPECRYRDDQALQVEAEAERAVDAWLEERYEGDKDDA